MTEVGTASLSDFLLARIGEYENTATNYGGGLRLLVECRVKRRIVELHPRVRHGEVGGECGCCGADIWRDVADQYPCDTLRVLALLYVEHPDYRDEWRP